MYEIIKKHLKRYFLIQHLLARGLKKETLINENLSELETKKMILDLAKERFQNEKKNLRLPQ